MPQRWTEQRHRQRRFLGTARFSWLLFPRFWLRLPRRTNLTSSAKRHVHLSCKAQHLTTASITTLRPTSHSLSYLRLSQSETSGSRRRCATKKPLHLTTTLLQTCPQTTHSPMRWLQRKRLNTHRFLLSTLLFALMCPTACVLAATRRLLLRCL